MNRRSFISLATALAAAFISVTNAHAGRADYSETAYEEALASGEAFILDFSATWCSTCQAQKRIMNNLQRDKKYDAIQVFTVDWDKYRKSDLRKALNVPRRSTIILFKDGEELDRIIAHTSKSRIQQLFDMAL